VTAEVLAVTRENSISIGTNRPGASSGPDADHGRKHRRHRLRSGLEHLRPGAVPVQPARPEATIRAVSEAAMREIISASQLAPILNRDRGSSPKASRS
jgi:membrane protease subunit HflK